MKDILLLMSFACLAITVFLWIWDRRRWKREKAEQEARQKEYFRQNEQAVAYIQKLEQELEQVKKEIQEREGQQEERRRQCLDGRDNARKAAMKIHLYVQLLKEQCGTAAAEKQCGMILKECERLLHSMQK